jgi:hypothetical protein
MEEEDLTYRNRVWWFGLIITTMIIAAITIFVSDIINHTSDDSWKPNQEIYKM